MVSCEPDALQGAMHPPSDPLPPGDVETESFAERRLPSLPDFLEGLRLTVIEGPDAGRSFVLDPGSPQRLLLGTSPVCDVRLGDPRVSRRHAAVEPAGRRYRITDLGSTNGTFIDGTGVVEAFLRGGEIVRCGGTALSVEPCTHPKRAPLPNAMHFGKTIGASAAMRRLYPLCERLARTRVSVLIEGETGTGKEVLAESLHDVGGAHGPFVVFDCTAVSPSLVEAELFGHDRGAFTGATADRAGVFEQAHGGTLFIDEIGDLEPALQPKLLRALDRGEIRRVGGQQVIRVDVRIIAATRRDLDREVATGRFRDDLFHRLAIARIELPPLRERKGDVTLLARWFAEQLGAPPGALTAGVLAKFEDYAWPGNLRELKNAVARHGALGEVLLGQGTESSRSARPRGDMSDPSFIDQMIAEGVPYPIARRRAIDAFERRYVERILEAHGGSVARASAASGIARRYFQLVKARSGGGD